MFRPFLVLLVLVASAGCSRADKSVNMAPAAPSVSSPRAANPYLAYQHAVKIDTEEQKVAPLFESALAACRADVADSCVILQSRLTTGRGASAAVRFRAKPAGIPKLVAALGKQAEITEQSTTAEDLARPIEDASKKLAMLKDYRAQLQALLDRSRNDVDGLIKLNKELAQVQSELEAMTGEHAHLLQRVETEILDISIISARNQSFWQPIAAAFADFGSNLSQGISTAITGIAYLVPWGIALLLLVWVGRKLWHRRKRARA
jgi:RNAse (barnase) inhibitor barstar